eukprot:scaffold117627_cov73-Phaeocystis_antarctica.AAC.7
MMTARLQYRDATETLQRRNMRNTRENRYRRLRSGGTYSRNWSDGIEVGAVGVVLFYGVLMAGMMGPSTLQYNTTGKSGLELRDLPKLHQHRSTFDRLRPIASRPPKIPKIQYEIGSIFDLTRTSPPAKRAFS